MTFLIQILKTAILLAACGVVLQLGFLLSQIGESLNGLHSRAARTLDVIHQATIEQRRYHKAFARAAAIDAARLGKLIENTDRRVERITREIENTARASRAAMVKAGHAAAAAGVQAGDAGYELQLLLAAGRGALENVERLAGDPALHRAARGLEETAANSARASGAAAEAAGHLRDAVSPRRKSFWRVLIEWVLPRPTIPVRGGR